MQEPTEEVEASVSMENVRESPHRNHRNSEAEKHTLFAVEELHLVLLPQSEDIRLTKKPRLEEPFSTSTTDEVATKLPSHDTAVSLPAAEADDEHAEADPVKATPGKVQWTPEEDAKLNSAVTNTCKKKYGKEYRVDWISVAALVPDRTRLECCNRWHHDLNANIDQDNRCMGTWTKVEDTKLKDAVQTHGGKNWGAIAALVPGRTLSQCWSRWHHVLDPRINRTDRRMGPWTEDEDVKLKHAVQTHGGKNWGAIAALVPGRVESQCSSRWQHVLISNVLIPNIDQATGRTGTWTADEDSKLKDAVQMHGGKKWGAIAALVLGRTQKQCSNRWYHFLDPSIDRSNRRKGPWAEDEDSKLKDAVQTYNGKNWDEIAALVPGRTKVQCSNRWHRVLDPSIDRANERKGKWAEDEGTKLKDVVQTHGDKNRAISALAPGRAEMQCWSRFNDTLILNINQANGHSVKWTAVEDSKLKDAVQMHGGKKWGAIAALVPGRVEKQCRNRWYYVSQRSPK